MTLNEFEFQVAGTTLHGQSYSPKTTRAVIILVHGLGEHSKRSGKKKAVYASPWKRRIATGKLG